MKVCGNCKFTKHDGTDYYCANENSERCTEYTRFGESCDEWEEKDDE